jgi:hypothetical protein
MRECRGAQARGASGPRAAAAPGILRATGPTRARYHASPWGLRASRRRYNAWHWSNTGPIPCVPLVQHGPDTMRDTGPTRARCRGPICWPSTHMGPTRAAPRGEGGERAEPLPAGNVNERGHLTSRTNSVGEGMAKSGRSRRRGPGPVGSPGRRAPRRRCVSDTVKPPGPAVKDCGGAERGLADAVDSKYS